MSATPSAPVERKVKAATAAAGGTAGAVSAIVLALLTYLWPHMNAGYKFEIAAAAPGILAGAGAFIAGYRARHTPRPGPPATPAQPSSVTVIPPAASGN